MTRLIVAFDGTGNRPETISHREITNVSRFIRSIKPLGSDRTPQIMEYVRGIGTGHFLDRFLGGATGEGISSNIEQGYHFVANNFQRGDDIYLTGFSRGAFTAMSLSGFLNHVGILQKRELHRFVDAYEMYRSTSIENMHQVRARYEQPQEGYAVPVRFLGLWDTVGHLTAVPLLTEKDVRYHEVVLAPNVSHAYHALAVHEIRSDFPPTLWRSRGNAIDIQQVWFPGCHSDVGGTYPDPGLSNLTLHWMADRARTLELEFDDPFLASMAPDARGTIHCSVTSAWEWRSTVARDIDHSNGIEQFVHASVAQRRGSNPGGQTWAAGDYALAEDRALALPQVPLTSEELARHEAHLKAVRDAEKQAQVDRRLKRFKDLRPAKPVIKRGPHDPSQKKKDD